MTRVQYGILVNGSVGWIVVIVLSSSFYNSFETFVIVFHELDSKKIQL